MKRRNPWIAAILNFFVPGTGFAYLGSPSLLLGGVTPQGNSKGFGLCMESAVYSIQARFKGSLG